MPEDVLPMFPVTRAKFTRAFTQLSRRLGASVSRAYIIADGPFVANIRAADCISLSGSAVIAETLIRSKCHRLFRNS